ncbi:phosphopantetheine-binding protein [Micromonospora sp. CPCC 206060]|uniref:phosphopantetheine-binding protein n=1 Tax=Micromonospora sp. CPCC 206060 TaxID=3122406 RepID=UPI002FEF0127
MTGRVPAAEQRSLDAVTQVVRDVLQLDSVRPDDDFFAVGGHSLLILHVIGALRTSHRLALPAVQFGKDARLSALAAACHEVGPDPSQAP